MDQNEAREFLTSLLNKVFRVTTTDGRTFVGEFKCTDAQPNVVLANTHEIRRPTEQHLADAAAKTEPGAMKVKMDVMSRFLGLVTIPGEHIVKMEVEEFASQVKGKNPYAFAAVI
ncbi:LSM domain-containing protein [Sodiomyces alkalinus F11]|uniref:LSM domain-containing protein n=1 Tax=Sodiomyces alkalinus (strain CBS 110278 / VKM F-3762 / F11) TaxID=1314773 RepID=A0A3N2Q684_SODAK|nr:LSM domain-containing protein [Sodiomyces alkalinus F11]ROT42293.1 LSM domain-containing protein [Sodiomyces alkalinus F11]